MESRSNDLSRRSDRRRARVFAGFIRRVLWLIEYFTRSETAAAPIIPVMAAGPHFLSIRSIVPTSGRTAGILVAKNCQSAGNLADHAGRPAATARPAICTAGAATGIACG